MKKILAIALAIISIVVMAIPAAADTIQTTATVGGSGGTAPYMIALFTTPDEVNGDVDGTNIYPEPAIPNSVAPLFPPNDPTKDGWKRIVFYLMADHEMLGHDAITGMTIDVWYPASAGGARKFEINALKSGTSWTASQSGYAAATYPAAPGGTPAAAVPPSPPAGWNVRELTYTDWVDNNADGILGNDNDKTVGPFLTAYGTRVVYGTNPVGGTPWNAVTAGARLQSDQALMLELTGWIWFHQSPLVYTVEGKAAKGNQSPSLWNSFQFIGVTSLYLDFSTIAYGSFNSDAGVVVKQGDTDLGTPGAPTIWDNGNFNAQVKVSASKMVLGWTGTGNVQDHPDYGNPSKTISKFDSILYYKDKLFNNVQVGQILFPADAALKVIDNDLLQVPPELGTTGAVLLQACRPAKIEFSVEPVSGIDNGAYRGTLTISIEPYAGAQPEIN